MYLLSIRSYLLENYYLECRGGAGIIKYTHQVYLAGKRPKLSRGHKPSLVKLSQISDGDRDAMPQMEATSSIHQRKWSYS